MCPPGTQLYIHSYMIHLCDDKVVSQGNDRMLMNRLGRTCCHILKICKLCAFTCFQKGMFIYSQKVLLSRFDKVSNITLTCSYHFHYIDIYYPSFELPLSKYNLSNSKYMFFLLQSHMNRCTIALVYLKMKKDWVRSTVKATL